MGLIGDVLLSFAEKFLYHSVIIIVILISTFFTAKLYKLLLYRYINKAYAYINVDPTRFNFIKNITLSGIYFIGFSVAIYSIPALRQLSSSLITGAGIIAAIIGFASQQAFSNIISGVFIVIFRPFRVNDLIEVDGKHTGLVEDITLRHTLIRNRENKLIIIPNSVINNATVINAKYNVERVCNFIEYNLAYGCDLTKASEILFNIVMEHPLRLKKVYDANHSEIELPLTVSFTKVTLQGITIRASVWCLNTNDAFKMTCDVNQLVIEAYQKAGIIFAQSE